MTASGTITGGRVLTAAGEWVEGPLSWADGVITAAGDDVGRSGDGGVVVDADGAFVLAGIIDLHGDAFERSLAPRSAAPMPVDLALADNLAQNIASGITTSYLSATDSWESGLRSRATLRELVVGLGAGSWPIDLRLHVRHEQCNVADHDELLGWLADGTVSMLSLNDHAPAEHPDEIARFADEVRRLHHVARPERVAMIEAAVAARRDGAVQVAELVAVAHRMGVPVASHDSSTPDHVAADLAHGVAIAEFPYTVEIARTLRDAGVAIMLGAPNLVRGGSHLGNLSVADAVDADVIDLLASDYHYPSLLQAPFEADRRGLASLAEAWALVSSGPAVAAGLADRGRLEPGARADVVVVDASGGPAEVRAVVSAGRCILRRS